MSFQSLQVMRRIRGVYAKILDICVGFVDGRHVGLVCTNDSQLFLFDLNTGKSKAIIKNNNQKLK